MLGRLLHGLPGHPLHPPLTDATIGMLVLAAALSVILMIGMLVLALIYARLLGTEDETLAAGVAT